MDILLKSEAARPHFRGDRMVAFSIALVWVLAIVSPQHFFPISTFYQELGLAAVLFLAALVVALRSGGLDALPVPWAVISFGGLFVVGLLDLLLRKEPYPDFMVWPLGTLLAAIVAALLAAQWKARGSAQAVMDAWAWAFVLGALGTALSMWVQIFRPDTVALWLFPRAPLQAPMGNIAQRNEAALVLGFGILALGYLSRNRWRMLLAAPCLLLFISALTLSQSRIGLAFLGVAGVCGGMLRSPAQRRWRGALLGLAVLGLLYAALQWLIYTGFGLGQIFPPALQRLADRGISQRVGLWKVAWQAFRSHPLLGIGFGKFAGWDYRIALLQPSPLFTTNAHNLLAQLAAETGLVGVLVAIVPVVLSVAKAWASWVRRGVQAWESWRLLAIGVCAMIAGYSVTEYPLWYVLYAVPFAMSWAVLDVPTSRALSGAALRLLSVTTLVPSLLFCAWAAHAYAGISQASSEVFLSSPTSLADYQRMDASVTKALDSPGFSPYVDALVFEQAGVGKRMLQQKIELGERVVGVYSSPAIIAKLARLYGVAQEPQKAADAFAKLCAYFPNDCGHAAENLRALQKTNPDDFDPVARMFFAMPESRIHARDVDVLRPWEKSDRGTRITIDPTKTLFGFDLALYASGLARQGVRSGTFVVSPR